MSPARLVAVLLCLTLAACSGSGPHEPETQGPALPTTSLGESTVGAPFSRSLAATQGAAPLSYSAQGLPPGILLDSQTGALSGSATAAGSFTLDASVTDATGRSDQRSYPLTVLEAPRFVTGSLPSGTVAVVYVARVEASGGKAPLVHALRSGSFPPGLSIDASGTLSGTPSTAGTYSFELSVTDAHGSVTRAPFTLEVHAPAPVINTTELPAAHVSRDYRFTLAVSGGTPPYSWSKLEGSLPAGLSLSSTGELSGTPTASGTFPFTAEVRDSLGQSSQSTLSLTVIPALAVATGSLPDGYRGQAYSASIEASGGVPPYTYSVVTGSLPGGVQVDGSGHFSGTPSAAGTFGLTLTLQDASQQSLTRAFPLTVYEPPSFANTSLRDGAIGAAYSETLQPAGGKAPFTYRLIVGTLPAGLRLQGNVLTGTPTANGTASFTLEIRDANNQVGTRAFTLRVINTLAITTTTLAEGDTGRSYSAQLAATGAQGTLSWSSTGTLPPGLSLSSSGLLSGTPTTAGSFTFTARVADAVSTDSRALTVVVQGPPVITTSAVDDAYANEPYTFTLAVSGGRAPYSWSITSSPPPNLALSSSGVLSGFGPYAGTFPFTVRVTDSLGRSNTRTLSLTAYWPPSVGTSLLVDGYVTEAYSQTIAGADGKPPYTFSVSSGSLPAGLTLASTGALTGTPTSAGTATLTLQVRDANGRTGAQTLSLAVYTLPTFVTASLPEPVYGHYYFESFVISGGKPPFYCFLESGTLPDGLNLNSLGYLTGAPTSTTGSTFTVRCDDAHAHSVTRTFTLTIYEQPLILSSTLPEATLGTPYTFVPDSTGNRPPFLWTYEGALPPGLTAGTDGSLTGTPTAAGSWSFRLTLQDRQGSTDSRLYSLTVIDPDSDGGPPDGGSTDGGSTDGGSTDGGPRPDGGTNPPSARFTVGQWNIEWFGSDTQGPPRSTSPGGTTDDLQISNALSVISGANADVWGLVEMVDTNDFNTLKAQLPGYDGFLADDPRVAFGSSYYTPSEQKVGVLYNSRLVYQSATLILREASTDFGGRPPLRVDFLTPIHGVDTPLTVIVLHMKAFADQPSYDKRQRAGIALKNYLDANLPTQHVFVLGDWNDDVDVSITYGSSGTPLPTPYEGFVADSSHYTFVTRPLSLAGEGSTTGFPDMIDHTLATDELVADYVPGSVHVLRPTWIPDYGGTTSDHYPVLSQYQLGDSPPPAPGRVIINEYLPNEPSGTLEDGGVGALVDYEFVELVNASAQAADLSGWTLWDGNTSAGARHVFSSGTVLQPGKAWVVYGGPTAFPAGTPNTEAASSGRLALNNSGTEFVTLRNASGVLVDESTYSSTVDNVSYNRSVDANPDTGFVLHWNISPLQSSAGHRSDGSAF